MCMCAKDPANFAVCEILDGSDVLNHVGTRIDHGDFLDAAQISVGTRSGHHARVRRDEPVYPGGNLNQGARDEFDTHGDSAAG